MKRYFAFFLCLFLLCGCSVTGERIKEPVKFYYLRNEYQYQQADGVITFEERESSGHRDNISYLLALYRMGPSSEDLLLPFPSGTAILMMQQTEDELCLALGNNAEELSDAEFSLACACLTLTCTELTDVESVTVVNGQRTITMTRDTILLMDGTMLETTEETK